MKMKMYDVFISYRREGGYETAKHLYDLLTKDGYKVSFDIDTLRNGDFDIQLLTRIEECKDFILIVDKHAFDRSLDPNFDSSKDWLRRELAHALKNKKNIVPIFLSGVDGFPDNLPSDICAVVKKNGPKYDKYYFDDFYKQLRTRFLKSKNHKKRRLWLLAIAVVLVGLSVFWTMAAEDDIFYVNPLTPLPSDSVRFNDFCSIIINENTPDSMSYMCDSVAIWDLWNRKAKDGNPEGELKLGLCYLLGYGCERDDNKAFRYISKSADQDNDTAIYAMGAMYYYGNGVETDLDKSIEMYRKAAERGIIEAQCDYGIICALQNNINEAFIWMKKASDQNYVAAQYSLAYLMGTSTNTNDMISAHQLMKTAAENGYRLAKLSLVNLYLNGHGYFRDIDKGIELLYGVLDEDPKNPMATYMMACCYFNGIGVDIDITKARELITFSAEQGFSQAALDIGLAFCTGNAHYQKDYEKAMIYFLKSAEKGHPIAQLWIGKMYENGWGVKKSYFNAMKWYNKAERQNVTWQTMQAMQQQSQLQNLNQLNN